MREAIWKIIANHNEDEWLAECRRIFPATDESIFVETIEMFLRQDIDDVWDD
jgi:hypothetical protein